MRSMRGISEQAKIPLISGAAIRLEGQVSSLYL